MLQGIVALMCLMAFYAVLGILAVLAGLYGLCRLLLWWDGQREERYDERQKESQGRAYSVAFWVGIVYLFAVMILTQIGLNIEAWLLMFVGLMLMFMTYRFCCLALKVGNPLFHDPKVAVGCDLFLIGSAAVDLFGALGGWFRSGVMDGRFWFSMSLGVCFIVECVLDIMELRREKEENAGGD